MVKRPIGRKGEPEIDPPLPRKKTTIRKPPTRGTRTPPPKRAPQKISLPDNNEKIYNLEKQISSLRTSNSSINKKTINLQNSNIVLTKQIQDKDKFISTLQKQLNQANKNTAVADMEKKIESLNALHTNLSNEHNKIYSENIELKKRLTDLEKLLPEIEKYKKSNKSLQETIRALEAQDGLELSLSELVDTTSQELESAQQQLKKNNSGFRLGKISMDLKVLPGGTGAGISFVRREELGGVSDNQLSTIKLDFNPTGATATPPKESIKPPNVTGYTEVMARRKLTQAGFPISVTYQAVSDEPGKPSRINRVVEQWPSANDEVTPHSLVTIALGKETLHPEALEQGKTQDGIK